MNKFLMEFDSKEFDKAINEILEKEQNGFVEMYDPFAILEETEESKAFEKLLLQQLDESRNQTSRLYNK